MSIFFQSKKNIYVEEKKYITRKNIIYHRDDVKSIPNMI